MPFAVAADGQTYDLGDEGTDAYRQALVAEYSNAAVGGEQCWRGRRSEGGQALIWDTFIGDVLQPNQTTAYALLAQDAAVDVFVPTTD
jgi:hypothetical protein